MQIKFPSRNAVAVRWTPLGRTARPFSFQGCTRDRTAGSSSINADSAHAVVTNSPERLLPTLAAFQSVHPVRISRNRILVLPECYRPFMNICRLHVVRDKPVKTGRTFGLILTPTARALLQGFPSHLSARLGRIATCRATVRSSRCIYKCEVTAKQRSRKAGERLRRGCADMSALAAGSNQ
jgi:hypothetical protein